MDNEHKNAARFHSRLPEFATFDDKSLSLTFCFIVYKHQTHWCNEDLAEYFVDNFRHLSTDDFKQVNGDERRELPDLLRCREIYVFKGRNVLSSDVLYVVVKGEIPWP